MDKGSLSCQNLSYRHEIYDEQIAIAYRQIPSSLFTMVVISILLSAVQWDVIDHTTISVWLILQLSISLWRGYSFKLFLTQFSPETAVKMKQRFFNGLIISSIIFGSSSFLLFPSNDLDHQVFLSFVIAGMSAGAIATLSSLKFAPSIFLGFALLPLISAFALEGDKIHYIMAVMTALFGVMLAVISRRLYDNTYKTLHSNMLYKDALDVLRCSEERFETIFKQAPVGIFYYDRDCIVLECNETMNEILEATKELIVGFNINHLRDTRLLPAIKTVMDGKEGQYIGPYHSTLSNLELHIVLHTSPVYDEKRNIIGGVGIGMDITERIDSENLIQHLAYYDTLTDIPNRFLLMERIQQSIIHCRRNNVQAGLMFINLDRFKTINDSLGHHIGDEILKDVVERIKLSIREEDTLARVGGDEFVVLIVNLGSNIEHATAAIERIAEKIHQTIANPFNIEGNVLNITSSIGIAFINNDEETASDLLKHADTAMNHAKKDGKNTTRFYQNHMDEWIKKRLFLERELRNAIDNNELELYYQPVIDVETRTIIGAEALLRWNHPKLGLVMPDDMISIAEDSGLIIPIGEWVLMSACKQCVEWKNKNLHGDQINKIAVNVSALQFKQSDFVDIVKNVLEETGIDPHLLEIELTESMIIESLDATIEKMNELRTLGIKMSIDDFGTGYSSLSYLKRLPFSTLKIDRSFVRDIMTDSDDAAMVQTMISMASIFNMNVIAEGVETVEQFAFLEHHKCRYFQGYLCSKPVPAEEFKALLSANALQC